MYQIMMMTVIIITISVDIRVIHFLCHSIFFEENAASDRYLRAPSDFRPLEARHFCLVHRSSRSLHPHICPHSVCSSAWPTAFSARCLHSPPLEQAISLALVHRRGFFLTAMRPVSRIFTRKKCSHGFTTPHTIQPLQTQNTQSLSETLCRRKHICVIWNNKSHITKSHISATRPAVSQVRLRLLRHSRPFYAEIVSRVWVRVVRLITIARPFFVLVL